MEEVGGEHHVVARVPELRVILGVEPVDIASADESKPVEDHHAAEEVYKDARVVKGTILNADESAEDWTHHSHLLVNHHPEVIHHAESAQHCVAAVLSLAHFECSADAAEETSSGCHSLIDQILHASGVTEEPLLEPC